MTWHVRSPTSIFFFRGRASIRRVGPMPSFLRVDSESLQHSHPFSGLQTRICDTLPLSDLGCRFYPGCQTGTLRSSRPFLRFWVDNLSGCNKKIISSPVSGSGSIFLSGLQQREFAILSTCLRVGVCFFTGGAKREFAILSLPVFGSRSCFYRGCNKENSPSSLPWGRYFIRAANKGIRNPLILSPGWEGEINRAANKGVCNPLILFPGLDGELSRF